MKKAERGQGVAFFMVEQTKSGILAKAGLAELALPRSRMLASLRHRAFPSAERRMYCTPVAPPMGFSPVAEQN